MINIIRNIAYKDVRCQFQQDLKKDISSLKNEERLFVKADKSTNVYKLDAPEYNRLLNDNITKTYKKAEKKKLNVINDEARSVTRALNIDDRVELIATNDAFITLKDHKENFANNPTCPLINPSKTELGRISKRILEVINSKLVRATKVNQWKNTSSVLQWYRRLPNKRDSTFICFDVVEFYPSITEALLNRALDFASEHVTISNDDRQTIVNAKHSLLFNNDQPWEKKTSTMLFDVTMGSYDGAETCELVGCYLLAQLQQLPNIEIGLYRDDGLAVTTLTPKETERIKKQICNVFKNNNLKITIEAKKKVINFLDVTLDMNTEKFKPYAKPTNTPLYVHSKSNHPPSIIKNIPVSVNRRLSEISSDAGLFDEAAKPYQGALRKSGYTFKLQFKPPQTSLPESNRSRNIIWFNPPYNRNVKSNIGRQFLRLIDQTFPVGHKLRKIFNRNTLKLSYSCMPNVTQIISGHNKTTLRKAAQTPQDQATKTCNCRKKDECPLKGTCLSEGIIYQATVTSLNNRTETYVGLTSTNFKARWRNHQTSFNNEKSKNSTELS